MAAPPPDMLSESWVRDAFLRDPDCQPTFFTDIFRRRLPTVGSIRADVVKLRSVSAAGRVWIADRRMAIASVGPWRESFIVPRKGEGYPAIIIKSEASRTQLDQISRLCVGCQSGRSKCID